MPVPHSPADDFRRMLVFACAAMLVVFVPYYFGTIDLRWPIPRDGTGLAVGRDFLNFWLYGRAAHDTDPARFYDLRTYWQAIEAVAGANYPGQQWSYPPSVMLLAAPFGALPYLPALALWTAISLVTFVAALRLWTRDPVVIAICVSAPAALFGLMSGQFAYLGAAAVLTALRWRQTRPVAAGVILGLMTIKPQLGLLFPVLLIATRNWRAFAAAAATGVTVAAVTALIWGFEVWQQYLTLGLPAQAGVLTDPTLIVAPFMPTVFLNSRVAGLDVASANAVQLVCLAGAIAVVATIFRHRPAADDTSANALFLAASATATPYLMGYDLLALSVAAVLLARPRLPALLIVLLPLLQMAAGSHVPGPALIPILFGVYVWRERTGVRASSSGYPAAAP